MIGFVLGFVVGGLCGLFFGVVLTCIVVAGNEKKWGDKE